MDIRRHFIGRALAVGAIVAGLATGARAAATIQYYADNQTGYTNGTIGLDFFVFSGTGNTWDLAEVGSTPEGAKRGRLTINSSAGVSWGGWGIQFKDYGTNTAPVQQNL